MVGRRIFGMGVDIVRVPRIERIIQTYGDRFLHRAYHPVERAAFAARAVAGTGSHSVDSGNTHSVSQRQVEYLASRWAVKEACHKALSRRRFLFPELYVSGDAMGDMISPHLCFSGELQKIMAAENIVSSHVSISHDGEYTVATVILETTDACGTGP